MATSVAVPADLSTLLTNAINAAIQSQYVQNMQWAMTPGCKPSVLNKMYFCDAASVGGSQTITPHADTGTPHGDSGIPHGDSGIPHGDSAIPHGDSSIPHSDAKVVGIHTDIPKIHTDSPKIHTDSPAIHTDTPAVHTDVPAIHTDIPATAFIYSAGLSELTGAGSMFVSNVKIDMANLPDPPPTEFSMSFSADVGFATPVTPLFTGSVQQTPLPAVTDTESFSVSDAKGTVAGVVTLYCTGNTAGVASGFYAAITNLTITLPTSVTSYSAWDGILASLVDLGLSAAQAVSAGDELLSLVTALLNGVVASEVMSALNSVLSDQMLAPCPC